MKRFWEILRGSPVLRLALAIVVAETWLCFGPWNREEPAYIFSNLYTNCALFGLIGLNLIVMLRTQAMKEKHDAEISFWRERCMLALVEAVNHYRDGNAPEAEAAIERFHNSANRGERAVTEQIAHWRKMLK